MENNSYIRRKRNIERNYWTYLAHSHSFKTDILGEVKYLLVSRLSLKNRGEFKYNWENIIGAIELFSQIKKKKIGFVRSEFFQKKILFSSKDEAEVLIL